MPGLMGRISTLIKAKITKLMNRAEDPAETLDYAYERQLEDLQNVKRGIADVVTSKKRLQLQEDTRCQQADKLNGQARQAMSAGREDLARAALERKQLVVQETDSLDQQITELEAEQDKLDIEPRWRNSRPTRKPRPMPNRPEAGPREWERSDVFADLYWEAGS